jgi:membrane protein DedA with SNARE-associated domain
LETLFAHLAGLQGGAGILAVFGLLVLCGFGVPIPEDIPLIAAGYLIHLQQTNWITALCLSMGGVLLGDSAVFFMGRRLGRRLFRSRLVLAVTSPRRIARVLIYYQRYGAKVIIAGRFLPGLRAPIFFVAGSSRVPYAKFLSLDALAAAVSVPLWLLLGSRFGGTIDALLTEIRQGKRLALFILVSLIGAYLIYLVVKARLAKGRIAAAGMIKR